MGAPQDKTLIGENAEQLAAHEFAMLSRLVAGNCAPVPIECSGPILRVHPIKGVTVTEWLQNPQSFDNKIKVACQITAALASIHDSHIVYRNISSQHAYIDPDEQFHATWINFERATRLSRLKQRASQPQKLIGDLAYFSPELTGRINRVVDWHSDLYGLGVLLYEIFAGHLPFAAESPIEWVNAHIAQAPKDIAEPSLPANLTKIIMQLLAKNPEDRYASTRGVLFDLERIAAGEVEFTLGEQDYTQSFVIPDRIFGRESEMAVLEASLSQIEGPLQFVTIAAPSGMGKTALVEELKRSLCLQNAVLCSGKFDQFAQGEPFSALAHAIDELARAALRWETATYEAWRKRIVANLHGNGRILTNLSPMMERILGEQPNLPEVDADLAARRITDTIFSFFKQCASQSHPVVFFIDDLQWVDTATMRVLNMLKERSGELRHILMIHAYRSNELIAGSPYSNWLSEVSVTAITLQALPEIAVIELLKAGFNQRIAQDDLLGLTRLLANRSGGSPFYLRELIASLIDKEAVSFEAATGYWSFHEHIAANIEFSADVADLMLHKVRELPDETQRVLAFMSFVGREFSLTNVMDCAEIISPKQAAEVLWAAINEDLIAPMSEGFQLLLVSDAFTEDYYFRFVHDKVQQAAQEVLPQSQHTLVKQGIAFKLLGKRDPLSLGREAIVLVDLLRDAHLGTYHAVIRRRLLYSAGVIARQSGQQTRSKGYLEAAWTFNGAWDTEFREDTLLIMDELAATYAACGEVSALEKLDQETERYLNDPIRCATVVSALVSAYCSANQMSECVTRTMEYLNKLKYYPPLSANPLVIMHSFLRAKIAIGNSRTSFDRMIEASPRSKAIQEVFSYGGIAFLTAEAKALPSAFCSIVTFIMKEGYAKGGAIALGAYSIVCAVLGQFKEVRRYTDAWLAFSKQRSPEEYATARMNTTVYAAPYWQLEISSSFWQEAIERAQVLYRLGNLEWVAATLNGPRMVGLSNGQSFKVFREIMADGLEQFFLPGETFVVRYKELYEANVRLSLTAQPNLDDYFKPTNPCADDVWGDHFCTLVKWKAILGQTLTCEEYLSWRKWFDAVAAKPSADRSLVFWEIYYQRFGGIRGLPFKAKICEICRRIKSRLRLKSLRKIGADPFTALVDLAWGCRAERQGNVAKAKKLYQNAYYAAKRCGSSREQVLAAEYSFRLLKNNNAAAAMVWLQRALVAAEEYSFLPKTAALMEEFADEIAALQQQFPSLIAREATAAISEDLDLTTLMQVGEELAVDQSLSGIVKTALAIFVKNLAATRAHLWQSVDGKWVKLAGDGDAEFWFLDEVARSQEIQVIDDAADSCLACRSAICLPLISGGQITALLIVENESLVEAFPRSRLPFLRTLSSQVATAIASASLYEKMEQKVQEKARSMVAIMANIEQGILTIGSDGKIEADYSQALPKILGVGSIAGRDAMEVIFQQADVAADIVDQVAATIASSLGEDIINFEVNSDLLLNEMSTRSGQIIELDWVPITNDCDEVDSIMLTMRDVTQVRLSQAVAQAAASELNRIGALLQLDEKQTRDFFGDARNRLQSCCERLTAHSDPKEWLELNFRDLHTLKGVARSYQFSDLAAKIHEVEEPYQSARQSSAATPANPSELIVALNELLGLVGEYERVEREVLKRQDSQVVDLASLRTLAQQRDWQEFENRVDRLMAERRSS